MDIPGESVLPGTPARWGASSSSVLAKLVVEATSLPVTVAEKRVSESGVSPDAPWRGSRVTRLQVPVAGQLGRHLTNGHQPPARSVQLGQG